LSYAGRGGAGVVSAQGLEAAVAASGPSELHVVRRAAKLKLPKTRLCRQNAAVVSDGGFRDFRKKWSQSTQAFSFSP
jgi:hypothetical protein